MVSCEAVQSSSRTDGGLGAVGATSDNKDVSALTDASSVSFGHVLKKMLQLCWPPRSENAHRLKADSFGVCNYV